MYGLMQIKLYIIGDCWSNITLFVEVAFLAHFNVFDTKFIEINHDIHFYYE